MKRKLAPTMNDVARELGLNASTVSRALSGTYGVKKETRDRVLQKAEEMGYRPDPALKALVSRRIGKPADPRLSSLAILTLRNSPLVMRKTVQYLTQSCERRGFRVSVLEHRGYGKEEETRRVMRDLKHIACKGVFILYHGQSAQNQLPRGMEYEQYVPVCINGMPGLNLHCVMVDLYENMSTAVEKASEYGFRRLGFLAEVNNERYTNVSRLLSSYLYSRYTRGGGIEFLDPVFRYFGSDPVLQDFEAWFDKNQPDCLLITHLNFARRIRKLFPAIHRKVEFIHLDCPVDSPGVKQIAHNFEAISSISARLMEQLMLTNIQGLAEIPQHISVPGLWVD